MTIRKSHSILIATFLITLFTAALHADSGNTAATAQPSVVNLNTADSQQLAYLPRVGAKAAQRIIDYRHEHGPFKKTSDLMEVKGFGEKTFNRLAPYLTVDGKTTLAAKVKGARKARAPKKSASSSPSAAR